MERRAQGQDSQGQSGLPEDELRRISELSKFELLKEIAELTARSEIRDESALYCALRYWWSKEYNRPYKDPLLATYTIEELAFEYYDKTERAKVEVERLNEKGDKIDTRKMQEAMDWAEQEEAKELAELQKQQAEPEAPKEYEPSAEEKEWMQKQMDEHMKKMKAEFGDDFGEDIIGNGED